VILAKVTGSVVSTQKVASMRGFKLLVVEPYRLHAEDRGRLVTTGRTLVAVDMLGAGEGELVMLTQGSSARLTPETKELPVDTVVIGIVDSVHVGDVCAFDRNHEPEDKRRPRSK
jgi:ethanolamine utilization protein EutN